MRTAIATTMLLLAGCFGAPAASAAPCESLASLTLPHVTITQARAIAAGEWKPDGERRPAEAAAFESLPAFCRVTATSHPTADSSIGIEVWLPASNWNGKFLGTGNGAWGGTIGRAALADGVRRGYAVAATDTGHTGTGASFATRHPEKLRDFADRAVHEMTIVGKALVAAHYARPAALAVFNGCSTGGRQALTAAQRFPDDFDGIIAGSPGNYTTHQAVGQVWVAQAMQHPASILSAAKLTLLHDAVIRACDAKDGVSDGVLESPPRCDFDPGAIACSGADAPSCLTAPQVDAVRKIYAGAVRAHDTRAIFPGFERGGELGWSRWGSAEPAEYATEYFKHIVFADPAWHFTALEIERDLPRSIEAGSVLDATDANLTRFAERGGKLILYAGWSDPGIAPRNLVNYFDSVRATMGASSADRFVRLFMVPGMAHCGGGDGTSTFDMLSALERWLETGTPPAHISAARVDNGVTNRTRPLCPYPQVATYQGSGSIDEAASFTCRLQPVPN